MLRRGFDLWEDKCRFIFHLYQYRRTLRLFNSQETSAVTPASGTFHLQWPRLSSCLSGESCSAAARMGETIWGGGGAAGRKSHRRVAMPSRPDRGRHQSYTNSFKCERVLVVSAEGERRSEPSVLNEGRVPNLTPPDGQPDGGGISSTKAI